MADEPVLKEDATLELRIVPTAVSAETSSTNLEARFKSLENRDKRIQKLLERLKAE